MQDLMFGLKNWWVETVVGGFYQLMISIFRYRPTAVITRMDKEIQKISKDLDALRDYSASQSQSTRQTSIVLALMLLEYQAGHKTWLVDIAAINLALEGKQEVQRLEGLVANLPFDFPPGGIETATESSLTRIRELISLALDLGFLVRAEEAD